MSAEPGDDRFQRLLESVLAGERPTSDPQVQAAMRDDDRFAREVVGLQQLQAKLSERALEVKQDLDHAAPELEAAVENLVVARGRQRVAAASRWLPWLLAAAVLVVAFVAFVAWPRTGRTPQHLAGELSVEPTADGRGLQFRLSKAPQGYFVVTVLDSAGAPAFPAIEVEGSIWVPDARLVAAWPKEGRVVVDARLADKTRIAESQPIPWTPAR